MTRCGTVALAGRPNVGKSTLLNALVGETESMLGRLLGEDIQLATALASDLGAVKTDSSQIEQVILNLAVNARDAMPQGGRLTIETANVEMDDAYAAEHFPALPGSYVMLSVSDTGIGMDAAVLGRLFEPFFTTKGPGQGSGLGLSAVYGTVKSHHGALDVRSGRGEGTTFTLWFPTSALAPVQPSAVTEGPTPRRARVLVVDDEPMVRNSLARTLQRMGHDVVTAGLGHEALATFARERDRIDLVILDMVMPDLSGPEVFSQLLAIDPAVRVVLSSGNALDGVEAEVLRGRRGWALQKPYTPGDLSRVIGEALSDPS